MKIKVIVDTNRIIAALIKNSVSREIIYRAEFELIGIRFSEKEVRKYKKYIIKKARINEEEFDNILANINRRLVFLDDELIKYYVDEAKEIMHNIDPADVPFIAAALATGAAIWSDDKHFEKQKQIRVYRTDELAKLL